MTRKEIEASTRWNIEHKKGIYYNNTRYCGISFTDEDFTIHAGHSNTMITFNYAEVEKIENVKTENGLQMTIFTR
jgi:hypothetical protein